MTTSQNSPFGVLSFRQVVLLPKKTWDWSWRETKMFNPREKKFRISIWCRVSWFPCYRCCCCCCCCWWKNWFKLRPRLVLVKSLFSSYRNFFNTWKKSRCHHFVRTEVLSVWTEEKIFGKSLTVSWVGFFGWTIKRWWTSLNGPELSFNLPRLEAWINPWEIVTIWNHYVGWALKAPMNKMDCELVI